MLFWIWKRDTINILKMYQLQVRIRRKYMKIALIYLRNNLRLNEISILTILQTYCKIQKNQLEIIVKATYSLHPNKYFEMLNLLEEACFRLHSNSRGADKILKDFCSRTTELLLLFSTHQFSDITCHEWFYFG